MTTIFYEIRTVDKRTDFPSFFTHVIECEVIEQRNIPFLKIVHYPNLTKSKTTYIALDTIKEYSIKEMEEAE